jgi:hypothetical protein
VAVAQPAMRAAVGSEQWRPEQLVLSASWTTQSKPTELQDAVCAVPEAGSAIAPSNNNPVVLNCMIASQVQRIIGAPYALPAPLGMASRFELLLDGNGRSPGSHQLRGSFQNRSVFRSVEASCRIKLPAHNHPTSEYVTVLSGDFCFGIETNSTPSAAGGLRKWTLPLSRVP